MIPQIKQKIAELNEDIEERHNDKDVQNVVHSYGVKDAKFIKILEQEAKLEAYTDCLNMSERLKRRIEVLYENLLTKDFTPDQLLAFTIFNDTIKKELFEGEKEA